MSVFSSLQWPSWFKGLPKTAADALPVRLGASGFSRMPSKPVVVKGFDQPLLWVTVALLAWGLVMVYSASIAMPDNPRFANYAHTHFLLRHIIAIVVAFLFGLLAFQVPLQTWERWAPWLFVFALVLLIMVLVPFIGKGCERCTPLDLARGDEFSAV